MHAYLQMVSSEENVIDILIAKVIFLGPPGREKTITRRRLFGEIENISNENGQQPSTGVIDAHTYVIKGSISRTTGILSCENWICITGLKDEKQLLCKLCDWALSSSLAASNSSLLAASFNEVDSNTPTEMKLVNDEKVVKDEKLVRDEKLVKDEKLLRDINKTSVLGYNEDYEDTFGIVDAIDGETMDKLPKSFQNTCIVYMQDTGGQPELMDMLPALTIGPALYLLFCRLNDKLNDTFEVRYRDPSVADKGGKSKFSLSDYILTIFSSIFCVHQAEQNRELDHEKDDSIAKKKELLSKSSKTTAYIIGTYKDEVKEDEIQKFDKDLQEIIRKTKFFEEGLIKFKSQEEGVLVYPIDNKFGNQYEILKLQQFLENALKKDFEKVKIPACWLAFNLALRSKKEKILSLTECISYGSKCHMSKEVTEVALWFFHHHAGILMHFPEVKDLKDIVIVDTQVIYDSITRLILLTLQKKDGINLYKAEDFQKHGKLTFKLLEEACGSILPQKFLALLKHFNVLAPISEPESFSFSNNVKEMYFMPCILNSVSDQDLDDFKKKHSCPIVSSLRLFYSSGFVPIGIFSALIARLAGVSKVEVSFNKHVCNARMLTSDLSDVCMVNTLF